MSARSVGIGEMFGWIPASFGLVGRNFGAMAGAAVLTVLAVVVLMIPVMVAVFLSMKGLASPDVPVAPPSFTTIAVAYGLMIVMGLVLFPPILSGWFHLCEAADHGNAPSAMQLFSGFRDGAAWLRLIAFSLLGLVLYALVMGLVFLAFKGTFMDVLAMEAANNAAMLGGAPPPPPNPAMLGKIFLMEAVLLPVGFLVQQVYFVGFAEVALRAASPVAALLEALKAIGSNLIKLIVFLIGAFFAAMIVGVVVVLLLVLVVGALGFLSKALAILAAVVIYALFLLVLYPVMFSFNYFEWKSLLGGERPPAIPV